MENTTKNKLEILKNLLNDDDIKIDSYYVDGNDFYFSMNGFNIEIQDMQIHPEFDVPFTFVFNNIRYEGYKGTLGYFVTRHFDFVLRLKDATGYYDSNLKIKQPKNSTENYFVRWMGCYDGTDIPLKDQISWEIKNAQEKTRPVAAACQHSRKGINYTSKIGLLISKKDSTIVKAYKGDAWTTVESGGLITAKNKEKGKDIEYSSKDYHEYDEYLVFPVFVGVVVSNNANKDTRKLAAEVARNLGLKYLGSLGKE